MPSREGSETEPASAATVKRVLFAAVSKDALPATGSPAISPEMDLRSMLPAVLTRSARRSSGTAAALGEASRPRQREGYAGITALRRSFAGQMPPPRAAANPRRRRRAASRRSRALPCPVTLWLGTPCAFNVNLPRFGAGNGEPLGARPGNSRPRRVCGSSPSTLPSISIAASASLRRVAGGLGEDGDIRAAGLALHLDRSAGGVALARRGEADMQVERREAREDASTW